MPACDGLLYDDDLFGSGTTQASDLLDRSSLGSLDPHLRTIDSHSLKVTGVVTRRGPKPAEPTEID
jgi:hypothetical protein